MRVLIVALLLGCLSACTHVSLDDSEFTQRLAKQAFNYMPVASYYDVSRAQHYPLSSQAALYVQGQDSELVDQFAAALRHHFQLVQAGSADTSAQSHTGFVLKVEQLCMNTADVNQASDASQSDRQQFRVTVSDIDKGDAFDSVTIKLKGQGLWPAAKGSLREQAFIDAAEQLAQGS